MFQNSNILKKMAKSKNENALSSSEYSVLTEIDSAVKIARRNNREFTITTLGERSIATGALCDAGESPIKRVAVRRLEFSAF